MKLLILFVVSLAISYIYWRRVAMMAICRRWKHCLLRPCSPINLVDKEDKVEIYACDCGMVWWSNVEDYQDTAVWHAFAHLDLPPRSQNGPGAMKIHSRGSRRNDR